MSDFIHQNFLLRGDAARNLYSSYASDQPIFDYHCHLSPKDLADNRQFKNLYEIWLEGDHYKWRGMRLNGLSERFCTGDATPREKFMAFAEAIPNALRNPLYHWTHLELARHFDIHEILSPATAEGIWEKANSMLAQDELSSWGILEKFQVKFIGTTDDPTDSLEHHARLKDSGCPAKVAPSFRPDKALQVGNAEGWNAWVDALEAASGKNVDSLAAFKEALESRVDHFASLGGCTADHGLARCPLSIADDAAAAGIFDKARSKQAVSADDVEGFAGNIMAFLGGLYKARGWVMQLHLGAIRNVNSDLFNKIGADVGCDSIDDGRQIPSLALLLGELSARGELPKTILYNLNPADNYAFATMCGNFAEEGIPGKVQFGSGWWFLDQAEGMQWQLNALSNLGLLSHFVGMLTDSRSMMSFPRHEYFRRLLCQLLGDDMERGAIPNDPEMVGAMVKNICYGNAATFFGQSDLIG
ncbi:MAG: glucuronate isomerase [Luteolibacter sp.]